MVQIIGMHTVIRTRHNRQFGIMAAHIFHNFRAFLFIAQCDHQQFCAPQTDAAQQFGARCITVIRFNTNFGQAFHHFGMVVNHRGVIAA